MQEMVCQNVSFPSLCGFSFGYLLTVRCIDGSLNLFWRSRTFLMSRRNFSVLELNPWAHITSVFGVQTRKKDKICYLTFLFFLFYDRNPNCLFIDFLICFGHALSYCGKSTRLFYSCFGTLSIVLTLVTLFFPSIIL